MKKSISERLIKFWEQGHLYILIALAIFAIYSLTTNVGVIDWQKELTYFNYIKTSLEDYHMLPYFWWDKLENVAWYPPIMVTAAFVAIPETPLFTPLIPLIMIMSAIHFAKLYIFVMFLVGAYGIVKLKKQLNWTNIQFRTYAAMFLFSPIIMQHLAVGYSPWINIFLFPWFVYFLSDKDFWKSSIGLAGTMALVLLQGGIYTFIWFAMILGFYSIINYFFNKDLTQLLRIVSVPILATMLALVRIYSTSYAYAGFSREWFLTTGYNPFTFLAYALTPTLIIKPFDILFYRNVPGLYPGFPPHDAGLFWGLSIIMLFVLLITFRKSIVSNKKKSESIINDKALLITSIIILFFSFYSIWAFFTKTLNTYLYLPFYESIKNYGFRLAIPAYLGITVLLANNLEGIWETMQNWADTAIWKRVKRITTSGIKIIFVFIAVLILILYFFKQFLLVQFKTVISKAYSGENFNFLSDRMEGLSQNSLEFYFIKAENVYANIQYWLLVVFILMLCFYLIVYVLRLLRNPTKSFVRKFPYFKFEMLLVIPLLFSISMWTKLAISIPYTEFPIQKVNPPTVVVDSITGFDSPDIFVTPEEMTIHQKSNIVPGGYVFPQILASDYKYLEVESENAILFDKQRRLKITPTNDKDIVITFNKKYVNLSLYITILSWVLAISFFVFTISKAKKSKINA